MIRLAYLLIALALFARLVYVAAGASPRFTWRQGPYRMFWKHVSTEFVGPWTASERRAVAEELNRVLRAPVYVGDQPGKPRPNLRVVRGPMALPGCALVNPRGVSTIAIGRHVIGQDFLREVARHEATHLTGMIHD